MLLDLSPPKQVDDELSLPSQGHCADAFDFRPQTQKAEAFVIETTAQADDQSATMASAFQRRMEERQRQMELKKKAKAE